MFGLNSILDTFDSREKRRCRMCIPKPRRLLSEENLVHRYEKKPCMITVLLPEPKKYKTVKKNTFKTTELVNTLPKPHTEILKCLSSTKKWLGTDELHIEWFRTDKEARLALANLEKLTNTTLKISSLSTNDLKKSRVNWDTTCVPYVVPEKEFFTLHLKGANCEAIVSLAKVTRFPTFQYFDNGKDRSKRKSSITIRRMFHSGNPSLVQEDAYIVKFPNIPLEQPTTDHDYGKNPNCDAPKDANLKWFSSWEQAYQGIKDFSSLTGTSYISYLSRRTAKFFVRLEENSLPYVLLRTATLKCEHGKDYNKSTNERKSRLANRLTRPRATKSKKNNCKAFLKVDELLSFPDLKLDVPYSARQYYKTKKVIIKALSENDQTLPRKLLCRVRFPAMEDHSGHIFGECKEIDQKRMDRRLVAKIAELCDSGIYDVDEHRAHLRSYVVDNLFKDSLHPPLTNRRYFPRRRDISNHYYLFYAKRIHAHVGRDLLETLIPQKQPDDDMLYRPTGRVHGEAVDNSEQPLLFVHRHDWQRKLFKTFWRTACLVEAKYDVLEHTRHPLFFIVVKSHNGYQLVGSFITQSRTSFGVEEAVQVLQQWSPYWNSSDVLVNKSKEQIEAIEKIIPDCRVLTHSDEEESNEDNDYSLPEVTWNFTPIDEPQTVKPDKESLTRVTNILEEIGKVSLGVQTKNALFEVELELNKVLETLKNICIGGAQEIGNKITKIKRKATEQIGDPLSPKRSNANNNYSLKVPSQPMAPESITHESPNVLLSQNVVSVAPEVSSYAYNSETYSTSLNETILKNGPHNLSLLQLKSLEPTMSIEENSLLVSQDPDFKVGWLYDEVINSYLWSLSKSHEHVMYASSTVAQIMQKRGSLKRFWQNVTLANKKYIFIPWNPTERHWVLLVVDLSRKCLIYLDPQKMVNVKTDFAVNKARDFIDNALFTKFKFHIRFAESSPRTLQTDSSSCGVLACMYAKWLACNESLVRTSFANYRQNIVDEIAGGCLNRFLSKKDLCKICDDQFKLNWIQCTRCQHWLHVECVGLTPKQANFVQYFVCP